MSVENLISTPTTRIDWQNTHVRLKSAGKYLSETGMATDPTWKFWMVDQTFWYVWAGRATMELPQGRINLKPGVCLWLRPGFEYRHQQDPSRPLGMYSVHFDLLTADGRPYPEDAPLPPELLKASNPKYVEMVVERLAGANPERHIWSAAMTPTARKLTNCLLTSLLMEMDAVADADPIEPRREPPHVAHIVDMARRIEEDPSQFKSVADMARELRYSPAYFSQLFRKIRTVSPEAMWIRSRLRHAAHMLLETDLPIKDIANRLGYYDACFFTRQFRRYMGMAPAQYRKKKTAGMPLKRKLRPAKGSDK